MDVQITQIMQQTFPAGVTLARCLSAVSLATGFVCLDQILSQGAGLDFALTAVAPITLAHAYKVENICEEKQTKQGLRKRCKTVLVKETAPGKSADTKDAKKAAEKPVAGKH